MIDFKAAPYAALVLRVSIGVVFIAHSVWLKLVVFTLPGTAEFFGSIGLPPALAYVVFVSETIGGIALILGVQTRWAAAMLVPVLLGATWTHFDYGWLFSNPGGGWEFPLFLASATTVQALLGDGAFALRIGGRRPAAA